MRKQATSQNVYSNSSIEPLATEIDNNTLHKLDNITTNFDIVELPLK